MTRKSFAQPLSLILRYFQCYEQSPEVEQAISVAGLLQHRADNEPLHRNDNPILDSNEEGYDSEDYKDEANDAKLLEFMLQNSQSQEDFHHQYDQLTSSLQEDSSDKILNETQGNISYMKRKFKKKKSTTKNGNHLAYENMQHLIR